MCEANAYIYRDGKEELLMEKVDRVIPAEHDTIFLESIFGERKVVKAIIRELELVHHRIILDEIREASSNRETEIWLEPDTAHGHFHAGEEVKLNLYKGYNMHPVAQAAFSDLHAFVVNEGVASEVELHNEHEVMQINLGQETDGLIQIYARESGANELYAKVVMEIGHHHHHGLRPCGLPVEIVPCDYSHAHLGENYEIQVLKQGTPLAGAEVQITYASTHNPDYPHRLVTDEEGRAGIFLTARGNYLFSVTDHNITSTFTLVKSF